MSDDTNKTVEGALAEQVRTLTTENHKLKLQVRTLEGENALKEKMISVLTSQMESLQAHAERITAICERDKARAVSASS